MNLYGQLSNEIFLGAVATVITLFISVINYYHANDQFFKELFTEFNLRYDKLNGILNEIKEEENSLFRNVF